MRLFYSLIIITVTALVAVVIVDYTKQNSSNNYISKITKQYYYAIEANYLEPTQESLSLSKKANSIYPSMPQINKLDFIYD